MRRGGDAGGAVAVAEAGLSEEPGNDRVRMSLALALLDVGDVRRARQALELALPVPTPAPAPAGLGGELGDDELEAALAQAETNPDEMMSANKVVEQTLEDEHVDAPEAGFDVTGSQTYATETMASLLEEQGRRNEASTLRRGLLSDSPQEHLLQDDENETTLDSLVSADGSGVLDAAESMPQAMPGASAAWAAAGVGPDHARSLRIVATLEGWLYNLKQNAERDSRIGSSAAGGRSSS